MKAKRVECDQCQYFVNVGLEYEHDLMSKIMSTAKCKLGKRVMFRMPVPLHASSQMAQDWGGYFRYCNEFMKIKE